MLLSGDRIGLRVQTLCISALIVILIGLSHPSVEFVQAELGVFGILKDFISPYVPPVIMQGLAIPQTTPKTIRQPAKPIDSFLNKQFDQLIENQNKVRKIWIKKYEQILGRFKRSPKTKKRPARVSTLNKILNSLEKNKRVHDANKNKPLKNYGNKPKTKPGIVSSKQLFPVEQAIKKQQQKQLFKKSKLESALDIPGVECGKVPIYEKLYHRSINESYEINPETGDFRILHGLDSVVGEWPWIVRILECENDESCSTCTGTLLNDRWIITAGHCAFQRSKPENFKATFGLYDLVSPENTSYSLPIEMMIVHPDYKDLNNDLSLMKLAKPVKFSDQVRPACLVHATRSVIEYAKTKRCYTVGYGLTEGMEEAIKLQKLEIRAKQASECNSYELGASQLKPGTVCIGPPPGKMGSSCKGDSGGPNLCYDPKTGSWSIFATVSYGPPVCDREQGDKWLTVSADLSNYRTWILSTILANS